MLSIPLFVLIAVIAFVSISYTTIKAINYMYDELDEHDGVSRVGMAIGAGLCWPLIALTIVTILSLGFVTMLILYIVKGLIFGVKWIVKKVHNSLKKSPKKDSESVQVIHTDSATTLHYNNV